MVHSRRSSLTSKDALKRTFRPEFLNRIDEIIIFDALTDDQIQRIVDLIVGELEVRLQEHKVSISLTDDAKKWLAKEGYDPVYGARPIRRAVQRHIENPLSRRILAGEFATGDHVVVDADESGLTFGTAPSPVAAAVGSSA